MKSEIGIKERNLKGGNGDLGLYFLAAVGLCAAEPVGSQGGFVRGFLG
jgi:hypothetical protein